MARYRTPLGRHMSYFKTSIETLHERMKPLNPVGFTHDEFLALFAPPEHWPILKTASEIANVNASGGRMYSSFKHAALKAKSVELAFDVVADGAPLTPRNTVVLPDAPAELIERLTSWVNRELEIATGFARAKALLDWLDANCQTKEQIRFLWPSLVTLCSVNSSLEQFGERVREFKTAKNLPAMPPEVRAACKETSGTIATAMLLDPENPVTMPPAHARPTLYSSDAGFTEGALGFIKP